MVFPRFDGGTSQCEACHAGSDAWVEPSGLICTSCHDSQSTAAHASIMTDPVFGESCDVCHGAGTQFGVEVVHQWGVGP